MPLLKMYLAAIPLPFVCWTSGSMKQLCKILQQEIENLSPDFGKFGAINARGVIVTAPGDHVDFVSRFFAPQVGINEDPVTGSAHTTLTPYWAQRLGKKKLTARQLSERKGYLGCELDGDRVKISGKAVTYLIGEIFI